MMRSDYDTMLGLADKLHYKSLTQLQETAFRTRSLLWKNRNAIKKNHKFARGRIHKF